MGARQLEYPLNVYSINYYKHLRKAGLFPRAVTARSKRAELALERAKHNKIVLKLYKLGKYAR